MWRQVTKHELMYMIGSITLIAFTGYVSYLQMDTGRFVGPSQNKSADDGTIARFYTVSHGAVYFRGGKLAGMDPKTFVSVWSDNVTCSYVKDKNAVYRIDYMTDYHPAAGETPTLASRDFIGVDILSKYGHKIEGVDPASFQVLFFPPNGPTYLKDKNAVYYYDERTKIVGADPTSFTFFENRDGNYTKDKNHVFFLGTLVVDADPETFSFFPEDENENWTKDAHAVFLNGIKQTDLDAASFKILDDHLFLYGDNKQYYYIKDKNHVVYGDKVLDVADPSSYEILMFSYNETDRLENTLYAVDKDTVYFKQEKIPDADPETFQILSYEISDYDGELTGSYAKDKNAVYFMGKKINNADPATFDVSMPIVAEDQFAAYKDGKRIPK